jgi:alpha-N-arabinofuranosidase
MRKIFSILLITLTLITQAQQNNVPDSFTNPILPGFYPDPSICRVGDDYYMVNSSFEWWPGVPIHHSKDLINWKQIGYVLNRPSQLTFKDNMKWSAGIWAPTIRYNNGTFYVIVTCRQCKNNCNCGDNMMVTSTSPYGPWSEPIWIDRTWGIDPDLFFDDDGKVWYSGGGAVNDSLFGKRIYPNQNTVWTMQLDIATGKGLSKPVKLTTGHAYDAKFAEGPHIYKRNGKYILLVAEGGTWHNHAVTGFISDSVTGPYIPFQQNPVLSHRQLGNKADITTIGHADMVQAQNGEWWAVALGIRDSSGYNQLGRETFLTKVEWENNVPVFNPEIGRVLMKDRRPNLPWTPVLALPARDNFDADTLQLQWNFLRTPLTKWYSLAEKKGWLIIQLRPETVKQWTNPSLIARRIQHFNFDATTKLSFQADKENETAGMVLMQNDSAHYRIEKTAGKINLYLMDKKKGETLVASVPYTATEVIIKAEARGLQFQFYIGETEKKLKPFGTKQDATVISQNKAGGFIGPYVGMYASSNGKPSAAKAAFDWFEYKEVKK